MKSLIFITYLFYFIMNSPISSRAVTPKNTRKFYWPESRGENSPKLCGYQERTEVIGWDDSPEPLKFDEKASAYARKKLDPSVSPLSSNSNPTPRPVRKPIRASLELIHDLSAIKALGQRVRQNGGNGSVDLEPLLQDDLAESLIACTQQVENTSVGDQPSNIKYFPPNESVEKCLIPIVPSIPPINTLSCPNNKSAGPPPSKLSSTNKFLDKSSLKVASNGRYLPASTSMSSTRSSYRSNHSSNQVHNSCDDQSLVARQPSLSSRTSMVGRTDSSSNASSSPVTIDLCNSSSSGSAKSSPVSAPSTNVTTERPGSSIRVNCRAPEIDSVFNNLLKTFREEEDEWLTQVDINDEPKVISERPKYKFFKSRSENRLESPSRSPLFRRTASFHQQEQEGPQPLKKQKSFHITEPPFVRTTPCSSEEIERKRLEALYRRKQKEIEQKRMEAQKRRNEKEKLATVNRKVVDR